MFADWPILSLVAVPTTVVVTGLVVAWAGRRGRRVDDHPICRRCGFDLFGRPEGRPVCSECGADLDRPRATIIGSRARRPALLAAGVVLALAGGARLATDVVREVRQDPNAFKPAWWLVREALGADPARRDEALVELTSRLEHGRLSQSAIDSVTERALAVQADAAARWDVVWGEWVERAYAAGRLTDARRDRYLRQAVAPCYAGLAVRPRVRRGDPFPLTVRGQTQPRLGKWGLYPEGPEVLFDDRPRLGKEERPWGDQVGWPGTESVVRAAEVPYGELRDGRHTCVVRGVFRLFVTGKSEPERLETMPLRLEAPWELLPADAAVAEVVDDPFLRPTIEPLVAAGVELTNAPTETVEAVVVLSFNRLPVGVAYDVFLRSGSTEWPAGRVCMPAGVYALQGNRAIVRGLADGPFDVVLRPNPAAAGESTDVLRVWNGELLLPNVLVTKRPFVPPYRASR